MSDDSLAISKPVKTKKPLALREKRRLAKNSLIASLGVVTVTGLMLRGHHGKGTKRLHYLAGAAVLGASYWHHTLYTPASVCDDKPARRRK